MTALLATTALPIITGAVSSPVASPPPVVSDDSRMTGGSGGIRGGKGAKASTTGLCASYTEVTAAWFAGPSQTVKPAIAPRNSRSSVVRAPRMMGCESNATMSWAHFSSDGTW